MGRLIRSNRRQPRLGTQSVGGDGGDGVKGSGLGREEEARREGFVHGPECESGVGADMRVRVRVSGLEAGWPKGGKRTRKRGASIVDSLSGTIDLKSWMLEYGVSVSGESAP